MKHTPGPWHIEDNGAGAITIMSKDGVCTAIPHGPVGRVANVKDEHKANALLIAAAPELYQLLCDLYKEQSNGMNVTGEQLDRINDTLKIAEGRA